MQESIGVYWLLIIHTYFDISELYALLSLGLDTPLA